MSWFATSLMFTCALACLALAGAGDDPGPSVGDKAPAFSLEGTDGKTHSLEGHLGKRPIVIAWFPKAFTSG
jgi:peroxiredoxin Q/BCP